MSAIEKGQEAGGLNVAYVLQNVGGARFDRDVGDTVPVKQSITHLRMLGHRVDCFRLADRSVLRLDGDLDMSKAKVCRGGAADWSIFRLFESAIRRIQREFKLPYYALFDSFRFFDAASRFLPAYDLCHEYHGLFSVGASLACRRLGKPYVLSLPADQVLEREVKGTPVRGLQGWLARRELDLAFRTADRIICVSEPAKRHISVKWGVRSDKVVVLPNGVDVDLFSAPQDPRPGREQLGINGAPVVMFVGGFQVWHGLDLLVEAFRRLKTRLPGAKLVLVGDGPARPLLETWIREAGLDSSAQITGFVPQNEVPKLLGAADVAVLPYPPLKEELWFSPLKLFEYMAAGKAIVATRAGQIQDVIEDGVTGVLVEPGDVPALEEALVNLLKDSDRRRQLGMAAQAQALEKHSWHDYGQAVEDIYFEVIRERRERRGTAARDG